MEKLRRQTLQAVQSSYTDMARSYKVFSHAFPIVVKYFTALQRINQLRKKYSDDDDEYRKVRDVFLDSKHEEAAPMIAAMYMDLGGVYLKAAQYAVAQGSLLPRAWEDRLQFAFNAVKPRPWKEIKGTLDREVGLSSFARVDETALAAASVGQVHRGTVKLEGDPVAIKVLYLDARRNMVQDLKNQRALCELVDQILKLGCKDTVRTVMDEFETNFPKELDLSNEVRNMQRAIDTFDRLGFSILVPRPYLELCAASVLTQQFVRGTTLAESHKKCDLASLHHLIDGLGASLFLDGFFHADAHPGNIIVLDDDYGGDRGSRRQKRLALIDWGQCCELDEESLAQIARLVLLLNARSVELIDAALSDPLELGLISGYEFASSAKDSQVQAALFFRFFDSTHKNLPGISDSTFKRIEDALSHDPKSLPLFSKVPSEIIFFGRTVGALTKCLRLLGDDTTSIAARWAPYARAVLVKRRRRQLHGRKNEDESLTFADAALLSLPLNHRWTRYVETHFPSHIHHFAQTLSEDRARLRNLVTGSRYNAEAAVAAFLRSNLLHLTILPALDFLIGALLRIFFFLR